MGEITSTRGALWADLFYCDCLYDPCFESIRSFELLFKKYLLFSQTVKIWQPLEDRVLSETPYSFRYKSVYIIGYSIASVTGYSLPDTVYGKVYSKLYFRSLEYK